MKNEIKNELLEYVFVNCSDVLCITSKERKKEIFDSHLIDIEDGFLCVTEREKGTLTLSELRDLIKFYNLNPVFVKNIFIEDIDLIFTDLEFENKTKRYKHIAEQLLAISIENKVNIILFDDIGIYENYGCLVQDTRTKEYIVYKCDFICCFCSNNFTILKNMNMNFENKNENRDSIYSFICNNLSNLNYILFK